MPIRLGPSGTAALCDALCVKRRTCSSWAYDTCTSSCNCWLKNTDRPLTPSSCRVSNCSRHATVSVLTLSHLCRLQALWVKWKSLAPRIEYGVDRSGGDLPGMPILLDCGADALTCEDMCNIRADCVAWAASTCGSRQCWLKQQVPAATTVSCRVSVFITICAWHALKKCCTPSLAGFWCETLKADAVA